MGWQYKAVGSRVEGGHKMRWEMFATFWLLIGVRKLLIGLRKACRSCRFRENACCQRITWYKSSHVELLTSPISRTSIFGQLREDSG